MLRRWSTILDADEPQDYVVATGNPRSVRDFVRQRPSLWSESTTGSHTSRLTRRRFRPADPRKLVGDAAGLRRKPTVDFQQVVHAMVKEQVERLAAGT